MSDVIAIDDLAAPVLNDVQRLAIDYGESRMTELTVDAVCDAARARTGLVDFGDDNFAERLGLQLGEMDADEERTGIGRLMMFADCVRAASNRLLIRDLLTRHPEILETPITRPVVVVGLPRSGTTHLVNLLAADTRFRSMPLWESYEPVPNPREPARIDEVDPRWTRCGAAWEAMQAAAPLVAAMHPMEPDHVHEEIELQMPDFSSYTLEWVARAPQWRDHYLASDQTRHYVYMKSALQILQWFRPKERWVLKSPQHLEQLGPLLRTFPDATIVVTHRDPVARRPVHNHDGLLRRAHGVPHDAPRVVPRLLDGAHRPAARCVAARSVSPGRGAHRGCLLRRVHGGRARHPRTGLRLRRHHPHRSGTGRDHGLPGRPSQGKGGEGRL